VNSDRIVETVTSFLTVWGLQVVGAVVVLVVGWLVARAMKRGAHEALARSRVDATLVPFLAGIVYYGVLAVVLVAVLNLFGIETTSLVAVLGAAGLAIGLALQGSLSNVASGVMLLLFRPFRVDDYVEIAGTSGTVVEIGLVSTVLKSPDNIRIVVPNTKIFGDVIKNYNGFATRRIDLVMGVSYDDELGVAAETMRAVVLSDERVLAEPEPVIAVHELGDSSVNLVVRPWCAASDYWPLRWDLTRRLKEELEAAGCSIPYPQRDVHLVSTGGENGNLPGAAEIQD
jgi:small conductance mechanosensitive channel